MKPLLPLYITAIIFAGCTEKPQADKAEIERFDSIVARYNAMDAAEPHSAINIPMPRYSSQKATP